MTSQNSASALHPKRLLVLGCGSVAQASIPLLIRDLHIKAHTIHIVDFCDNRDRVAQALAAGAAYELFRITRENLADFLRARSGNGDIVLDLTWNIDCLAIVQWCRDHGVRYINTSIELWDPYQRSHGTSPQSRTLYARHQNISKMIAGWKANDGPSAVLEHGANPGLVSHLVKQALVDITKQLFADNRAGARRAAMENALANEQYNRLAQLTGTKVIHIAERDSQITNKPKNLNEFCNTWSVEGFYEEGIAPAELGWGTHEQWLPANAHGHENDGPRNQICLAQPGMETWARSWVPSGEILGMLVRHGEAYTISKHLSVTDDSGAVSYRPTVYYVYHPCDAANNSILELRMHQWRMQPRQRILNNDIINGRDELGVLLMGHDYRSWWTGSILSIEEARTILPDQSATTLQVAGAIVAAMKWLLESPFEGVRVPDELPWRKMLAATRPYIGELYSMPTDWTPLKNRNDLFAGTAKASGLPTTADPWQFANFLVPPANY